MFFPKNKSLKIASKLRKEVGENSEVIKLGQEVIGHGKEQLSSA